MDSKTIGTIIRDTRRGMGIRQDELASVAGLSTRALSSIENGKLTAQIGLVLNVLNALGIIITLSPALEYELSKEQNLD
jgi:transcriptional regulator with XRE-family HTH domain